MADQFDAVILGAGHNGLILQAYLARAGLSTVIVDRCAHAGGGLTTIEFPSGSGFRHNTHAFYHRALTQMPWYADLELAEHGARYLEPPLNVAMILRDGRVLQWWTDFEKTVTSFAQFSERDAATLRQWRDTFRPIVREILIPEAQSPPQPAQDRQRRLQQSQLGQTLLATSKLSPVEFVQREFEHPAVQAGLLFFNGLREVDLRLPGFGHHIPALLASDGFAQMCLGGSEQLANALCASVKRAGGQIRLQTTPTRILVESGRAVGVETSDGDLIHAKCLVASSLNPQQTFCQLIDAQHLPSDWRKKAENFRYNLLAPLFALNLNLPEPPHYTACETTPELEQALMVILGLDDLKQFFEIIEHHQRGTIPPTVMWGSCPTKFDPSQAPPGQHTAFMWEKLPYQLNGDPRQWDQLSEEHGRQMLQTWSQYAPNVAQFKSVFTRSPLDVERTLWNMSQGDLLVGSFEAGQVGYHRPFPGAGHYRGHLQGLYLCGSSCHPGGNITGLPGYNAAQVILADLGQQSVGATFSSV